MAAVLLAAAITGKLAAAATEYDRPVGIVDDGQVANDGYLDPGRTLASA